MTNDINPCVSNKCILLPVCRNKTIIQCNLLYNYYSSLERVDPIDSFFPKLHVIKYNEGKTKITAMIKSWDL